ncbi:MAG: MBL fold metallo-hydrolase, partial [Bacilli bacterium]
MKMHIIASGSKGNASIVYDDSTCILIDCGISKKRLVEGLKEVKKALNDIDFVLFTHNHIDHILGESYFSLDKKYARKGTINLLQNHELIFNHIYTFKDFQVELLETSHDAIAPCGFLFKNKNESLVYITDSGFIPESTFKLIKDKTYYFIESNHDYDMLINSNRPLILKKR